MKKFLVLLLLLLLLFVMSCGCECKDGMSLTYQGTIKEVNVFNDLSGDYLIIVFEDNHSALIHSVIGDELEVGQEGCLYFCDDSLLNETFIYYWEAKNENH